MRKPAAVLALLAGVLVHAACARAAAVEALEHPLARSRVAIKAAGRGRLVLSGRWRGARGPVYNPQQALSTLRIAGGDGEADTGLIRLDAARWRALPRGKGFRYDDPTGSAGGIRSVVLRAAARGGRLAVTGGPGFAFALDRPVSALTATLAVGPSRWCARFEGRALRARGGRLHGTTRAAPAACPCAGGFDSTLATIQAAVFEQHGCTTAACHGAAASGGLDLRADVAWANLVDVPSTALPDQKRVDPGDPTHSLLWRKLAKATLGGFGDVPGAPMPNGLPPLSSDELGAIEEWIRAGAPATGVVAGTDRLLSLCLAPPDPIKIRPPGPPAPGTGVQLYGPAWPLPPESESEVCFAVWYDFAADVPAEHRTPCPDFWGGPTRDCFYYDTIDFTQDPNSHHSIVHVYRGQYDVSDPGWGGFTCHGGAQDGVPCTPQGTGVPAPAGADCGPGGGCAGSAIPSIACLGYGPPDFNLGFTFPVGADSDTAPSISVVTQPRYTSRFAPGAFAVLPVAGIAVFNSHAFNVTGAPTTNEQWLTFLFGAPDDRQYPVQDLFDATDIFAQNVPPFEQREYCRTHTFDQGTRLFELSSHTHKRGTLFRVWGPGVTAPCSAQQASCLPESGTPVLVTTNYADPAHVVFDPPVALDGEDVASRTYKFCAVYDNGFTDAADVRRGSTAPDRSTPCDRHCVDGPQRGKACATDAACDSAPGRGDGRCDACTLRGGVTTDDEMFILLGSYYCVDGSSCYLPPP
jgi:hypothetical protein